VTVAVNVTDCPDFDGFAFDASEVDVEAAFTVSEPVPVADWNVASPAKLAAIVYGEALAFTAL
jgi:hypothetical protein